MTPLHQLFVAGRYVLLAGGARAVLEEPCLDRPLLAELIPHRAIQRVVRVGITEIRVQFLESRGRETEADGTISPRDVRARLKLCRRDQPYASPFVRKILSQEPRHPARLRQIPLLNGHEDLGVVRQPTVMVVVQTRTRRNEILEGIRAAVRRANAENVFRDPAFDTDREHIDLTQPG